MDLANRNSLENFIDNIRAQLKTLKENEYLEHNQPIEIPPETNLLLKTTNSPHDYKILMQRQKQIHMRQKGFANTTSTSETMESDEKNSIVSRFGTGVNLLEDLDISCYQRPWGKLEHELKINRTMHFVQREIGQNGLNIEEAKQLRILLINAINHRLITKKTEVEYDDKAGELKKIHRLEYDPSKKYYYLRDCESPFVPPQKGENGYITHVSELSADQLKDLNLRIKNKQ